LLPLSAAAQKTYLHCGRLLDVRAGKLLTEQTLVVENGRVQAVQAGYTNGSSPADKVIDLKNRTVLPGLIDCHVHLEGETNPNNFLQEFTQNPADVAYQAEVYARTTLRAGFTTVRDLGGSGVNISLRNAINRGMVVGPRVFTVGKAISGTGGHMDPTNGYRLDLMGVPGPADGVVNGPDQARQAVREQYKRGADLIKIASTGGVLSVAKDGSAPQMTEEEIRAVVETAHDLGLRVACHAHGAEGMKRAVRAGVNSIEHGTFMDDDVFKLMKKNGTWYVPTIIAGKSVADSAAKHPTYYPPLVTPKALAIGPKLQGTFGRAYKSGVKIAFGTDASVYRHGVNAKEFQYMVEAGMPALEALRAATLNAAELLGQTENLGSLEPGKFADVVAVDGNPLQDIGVMQQVRFVMKQGTVYRQD
jgi:imidazolonepropionase-like amidohydrolase